MAHARKYSVSADFAMRILRLVRRALRARPWQARAAWRDIQFLWRLRSSPSSLFFGLVSVTFHGRVERDARPFTQCVEGQCGEQDTRGRADTSARARFPCSGRRAPASNPSSGSGGWMPRPRKAETGFSKQCRCEQQRNLNDHGLDRIRQHVAPQDAGVDPPKQRAAST